MKENDGQCAVIAPNFCSSQVGDLMVYKHILYISADLALFFYILPFSSPCTLHLFFQHFTFMKSILSSWCLFTCCRAKYSLYPKAFPNIPSNNCLSVYWQRIYHHPIWTSFWPQPTHFDHNKHILHHDPVDRSIYIFLKQKFKEITLITACSDIFNSLLLYI